MRRANAFNHLRTTDLSSFLHVALFGAHFMRVFLERSKAPGWSPPPISIFEPLVKVAAEVRLPILLRG
jgi:hypothetical protein